MRRKAAARHEVRPIDTSISVDPRHLIALRLKLAEYEHRQRLAGYEPIAELDENSLAVHGFVRLNNLFKQIVLQIVVDLAHQRDTDAEPITMPEVGAYFEHHSGVSVLGSMYGPDRVPFVRHPTTGWPTPDFGHPPEKPNHLGEVFMGAYGVIYSYAWGRTDYVQAGTGLPVIPRDSTYYQETDR